MKLQKKKGLIRNYFMQKFQKNYLAKGKIALFENGARSKNSNGITNSVRNDAAITLIALIISIIVMLILAGVSLSAIVGDNGILTQAQNATYQSSIAVLEEYMQELYVTNYDEFSDETSKIDALLSKYPSYFYIPANEGIGGLRYIVDSDGHVLYLIKKSGLPDEIQDQLQDGNAGGKNSYSDYMSLNDVYGITTDLKVYYCSNGIDTIMGVTEDELNSDNPLRTVFTQEKNANIYALLNANGFDQDGNGTITAEECKSVKSLTITTDSGITSFTDFYNLISLQEIIFDGVNLTDLKGLQNCPQLNYVYFKSSTVADYSALSGVSKLKYLYLYDIDDNELSTLCNGIKSAEFKNLEYLAVVGNNGYISNTGVITYSSNSKATNSKNLTSLMPLALLSSTTKNAVKYLSVNNNNITDLTAIKDYTNLILLRCEYNRLSSLDGIEDMNSLIYLCGAGNNLGIIMINGEEAGEDTVNGTSIKSLANKTKLEQVNLSNNVNLANVSYFEKDTAIAYLYLDGCSKNMDISSIREILTNCSPNYKIPVKFLTGAVYKLSDYYTSSEVTYSQLKNDLYENTYITHLSLEGITPEDQVEKIDNEKITNNRLNEILKSMTNLQYLTLKDSTVLTSIDFIAVDGVTKLIELDLMGTSVSGENSLSKNGHSLNDYATKLETLKVSDGSDFKNIVKTINNLTSVSSYWVTNLGRKGLICSNIEAYKCLENLTSLTNLVVGWSSSSIISEETPKLDLRQTSLKNIQFEGLIADVFLPNTVTEVCFRFGPTPIIAENSIYLTSIRLDEAGIRTNNSNFLSNLKNAYNLESIEFDRLGLRTEFTSLSEFLNYNFLKTTSLKITAYSSSFVKENKFKDLNGIEYFPNLQTLTLNYTSTNLDVSAFNSIEAIAGIDKSLTTLNLGYANINSLSGLENLTELTSLSLNNNSISNLKPLESLTKLQTLDLSNNVISDTASYTDTDGTTKTVNNLQILANLNSGAGKGGSLTTLYLAGNSNIVDFTPVSSLSWTAKSGF